MAWNEPNGNKDPWGRKSNTSSELDNALNDLNKYVKNLFGGTSGGSNSNKKNSSIIGAVILTIYLLSGIYIVNEETGEFIKPNDPVAFFEAKEQRVRERFVNIAEAKILREKVRQCYYKSGVNHYQYVFIIVSIYLYQYVFISTFITNIYLK